MTTPVKLIRSDRLPDVAEYAYASKLPADAELIFLAGSCPLNADGSTAAIGDYAGHAAKCIDNMHIALAVLLMEAYDSGVSTFCLRRS